MKKISAILIGLLLVVSLAVMVLATESVQFTIIPNKTEVTRGEIVEFSISMSELQDCRSAAVMPDYDENVFEYVDGECVVDNAFLSDFGISSNGILNGVFTFKNSTNFSGEMFTFRLKVKEDAAFAETVIVAEGNSRNTSGDVDTKGGSATVTVVCTHEWSAWTEADGVHGRNCRICGATEAAEHVWDNGMITTAPTCHAAGVKTYTCGDCKAAKTEAVAQLTHKWDAGKVTQEATCAVEGIKIITCEYGCGDTKTEILAKTDDHKYGEWTNAGDVHKHICSVCTKEESASHEAGDALIAGTSTHWNECFCGAKVNEIAHAYNQGAWEKDAENHWHACTCGAKGDLGAHSFTEKLSDAAHKVPGKVVEYYYDCAYCDAIGTEVYHEAARGDMNKDGEINEDDAIYLLQYVLLGEDMFPID